MMGCLLGVVLDDMSQCAAESAVEEPPARLASARPWSVLCLHASTLATELGLHCKR